MIIRNRIRALALGAAILCSLAAPVAFAADGADIPNGTGPTDSSTGGTGANGGSSTPGTAGGDGGDITSNVSSTPGDISATSTGGTGGGGGIGTPPGAGGNGGTVNLTQSGTAGGDVLASSTGGNRGSGGAWGTSGGNGGTVNVDIQGDVAGDVTATSSGGGANTFGGAAGSVKVTVSGEVGGNVVASSLGGEGLSGGTPGAGADVSVTISGTVVGDVEAKSEGTSVGTISVVIDGGVVTGTIKASASAASSLTFDFDISDQSEFDAATAALLDPTNINVGTVTINGAVYRWQGFDELVNALRYVAKTDVVVVTITTGNTTTTNVGDASPTTQPKPTTQQPQAPVPQMLIGEIPLVTGKPEMAKCSGDSSIRTVRQNDGSIVVIQHSGGADTLLGQLKGGSFRSNGASSWTVQVSGTSVEVSDGGNSVSSCSFS